MSRNKVKNDNITRERKQDILRTAVKKFSEKGYQGTSVSEIAKELNISQGMVFWYYETKENLFKMAFMEAFSTVKIATSSILQDLTLSPQEKLRVLIPKMLVVYKEKKEGCMLILQMVASREMQQMLSIDVANVYEELYTELEKLFREAQASNPQCKARNFVALLDGLMIQTILGLDIGSEETLVKDILHRYELT